MVFGGGDMEIAALSEVLGVKFCIIKETREKIFINANQEEDIKTLYLAYNRARLHYCSLKIIEEAIINQPVSQTTTDNKNQRRKVKIKKRN